MRKSKPTTSSFFSYAFDRTEPLPPKRSSRIACPDPPSSQASNKQKALELSCCGQLFWALLNKPATSSALSPSPTGLRSVLLQILCLFSLFLTVQPLPAKATFSLELSAKVLEKPGCTSVAPCGEDNVFEALLCDMPTGR